MSVMLAKIIWLIGVVGWFIIRYPHDRRSRRTPRAVQRHKLRERILMVISATGLGIVPAIYVFAGSFRFANSSFHPLQGWLGLLTFAGALWLFYRTHKALGRNWSVTLEVREEHTLVTRGPYNRVRHPMYSAFWLWALAQALLLPNWIAGFSGIVGFGTLFFMRIGNEERLMLETFGNEYLSYRKNTWRVLPGIF